jgi:hypothetical protein
VSEPARLLPAPCSSSLSPSPPPPLSPRSLSPSLAPSPRVDFVPPVLDAPRVW